MKETILSYNTKVGETYSTDDGRTRVRDISLGDLILNCGFIDNVEWRKKNDEFPENFAIRFSDEDGEMDLIDIYDADTGEVYWWTKTVDEWTDMDEKLITDLLMWGELSY